MLEDETRYRASANKGGTLILAEEGSEREAWLKVLDRAQAIGVRFLDVR